ncbi:GNAT family N-acetyltransferase [Devosia rhodophyticola]|uniref:GNAT family N-acetyltransferase n=2 Tax=Devosia rhodophyticola TaxID=3026423 RepID=A0ABY7YVT1_9HYPH|nr:GNAT family N-acetyltransferase [Devosia rhodophyticola]WDR05356.1 GNAT family N-acetyltransferase [Devosia rhodophyticola]
MLNIRESTGADAGLIVRFVRELADYEKLGHEVAITEADVLRDLFSATPKVFCQIAEWDGEPVGFALWYYTFSTFQGRSGIWLEDLYVDPSQRGRGIGKALLADLAQRCTTENLGRLEWAVLDWNQPSIDFYLAQGARLGTGWHQCRLDGAALLALGNL